MILFVASCSAAPAVRDTPASPRALRPAPPPAEGLPAELEEVWESDPPLSDPALAKAAGELARRTQAEGRAAWGTDPEVVRHALSRAGATSQQARSIVVRASTRDAALSRLRLRVGELVRSERDAFTHLGLGIAEDASGTTAILLLVRSLASLEPVPTTTAVGSRLVLRGHLLPSLAEPELYVTPPDGRPIRLALAVEGRRFSGEVDFYGPGRWMIQVMGTGAGGPVVAAHFPVFVGIRPPDPQPRVRGDEPADVAGKERALADAVNGLRVHHGLGPLMVDPTLGKVARAFAEEIRSSGRLAHRSEISGELGERLRKSGYGFVRAGENLAQAPGALEAQASLEASPRHLKNLLDPLWREAGYGVAIQEGDGGRPHVIVVQVFASP